MDRKTQSSDSITVLELDRIIFRISKKEKSLSVMSQVIAYQDWGHYYLKK